MSDTITASDISAALSAAGIAAGDVIMVHSSLKSFGHVDGGAEAVVDALLKAVGPEGTVVVPTLTATYTSGSASGLAWNRSRTPSRVGAVTETLRTRPGAVRSEHPTHSLAAIGQRAAELMSGHWPASTFNIDGPYGKYVKAGGKIVFLGVLPVCNTMLHAVEDWLEMPYLKDAFAVVERPDGTTETVKVTKAPLGHRDFYHKQGRIHRMLEEAGAVSLHRLNSTEIRVMPAKRVVAVTAAMELEHTGVLLCGRPDCDFCRAGRRDIIGVREAIRRAAGRLLEKGLVDTW